MRGGLLYHAAPARLPCGRLRCRHTHRSDYSVLSLPPLTTPLANHGSKRLSRAALDGFVHRYRPYAVLDGARSYRLAVRESDAPYSTSFSGIMGRVAR
jgi:hypothetical protein